MTDATFSAIRQSATLDGADHAESICHAFRVGYMQDNDLTPLDVCDEYGTTCGDMADILPDIVPEVWAVWVEAGDVDAMGDAWDLYVAFFAEGFAGHVWAHEGAWAVALGCV